MTSIVNNRMIVLAFILCGCAVDRAAINASVSARGQIGIGRDQVASIARSAIKDIRHFFANQSVYQSAQDCPVRIMLDSQRLDNESSERIDFDLITKGFRDHINDKANEKELSLTGRPVIFVDVDRNIVAGEFSRDKCRAPTLGADYFLAGRIISEDKIDRQDVRQKRVLITFWLLDLETGAKTWTSPSYVFKNYGQNDVIYQ